MFRFIEKNKKDRLVADFNDAVDKAAEEYRGYCEMLCPDLLGSLYYEMRMSFFRTARIRDDYENSYRLGKKRLAEFEKEINNMTLKLKLDYQDLCVSTHRYWEERAKGNEEKMNALEGNCPLFITLKWLWSDTPSYKYCMCYEFSKVKSGVFSVYVFDNERTHGYVTELSYFDWEISKMTEEEFEKHYIIGRMNTVKYDTEEKAIEYDNYLRRLFHGQREVI